MDNQNKKFKKLRSLHGALHEWNVKRKKNVYVQNLIKSGYKKSQELQGNTTKTQETYPIDIVVTWVDGNDPKWLAEKRKYDLTNHNGSDVSDARYRDWDIFQFWFRAIEKNVPWVRFVYLVTYGHIPSWLNLNCPKLKVINHSDFIPEKYLPTFSSHTIEANLWRIPNLSEHFIYLNDDMFVMKPLEKYDFFHNGYPKYCGIARPIKSFIGMNEHRHARFNCVGVINSYFDVKKCIEKNPEKWFSYKYGEDVKYNIRAYEDGMISGMYFSHVGTPFRKSVMIDFYNHFPEIINKTCSNRFRTSNDIMHQVFQMWEMFNGTFEPVEPSYYGDFYSPSVRNIEKIVQIIKTSDYRMLCINDHEGIDDFERIQNAVKNAFASRYPEKSCFEL